MLENQIKEFLYFCYKNDLETPLELIKTNNIKELNKFIKENCLEEDFEKMKIELDLYTHFDGENRIDLSNLPQKELGEINHINTDYKQFIGLKIPFYYNFYSGEFEIVGLEIVYVENASEKISDGYKQFEEEYGTNLFIISRYMLKYKDEVVALSTADLENIRLEKFESLRG